MVSHLRYVKACEQYDPAIMDATDEPRPLLRGRGVLLIEDFCRETGLEQSEVEELMRSHLADGALWKDDEGSRGFGLFDDVLPSAADLEGWGLSVLSTYDPDKLRSSTMPDGDDGPEAP